MSFGVLLQPGADAVCCGCNVSGDPCASCDCADCDGVTVWTDSSPTHTGTPIVCKNVDLTITLPRCAVSWTYHFEQNSSADRFTVNGVEYAGCTPLFGSPLPNKDGTVAVSVSGLALHIVVQCSCATPAVRNSSWAGYIICNVP